MALTREDIIKDKELVSALNNYGFRRNGELYDSKEEAIDSFLEDYRALQSNSVSAAKFIRYLVIQLLVKRQRLLENMHNILFLIQ